MPEFTEDQMNAVAEELFIRMNETIKAEFDQAEQESEAANPAVPLLGTTVPELSTDAQADIQSEAAKSLATAEQDPVVPPQMTRKVWKEMMRIHFTVRRPVVKGCGHKINIASDPRSNCDECWFAYFNNNGQMTGIADECFREAGRDVLERSRGKKFVKYFLKFMSTIARFQREAAERELADGVKVEGSGGSVGARDFTTDTSVGGVAGEAQSIGQISSDPSVSPEGAFNGGEAEGFGTGVDAMRQGLVD